MSAITLADIRRCIEGWIPAVIATLDADGEPNITYLSAVQQVDDERIALSNQFMSKTARNLVANPRASMLVLDPVTNSEYRLDLCFERTERRGPVFERLRKDVDDIAAMASVQDVFRLRAADIFRVEHIEAVVELALDEGVDDASAPVAGVAGLGALMQRLGRCADLDAMVDTVVRGLDDELGYGHSMVLLVDETGERLFTIASHGYATEGVGSELALGDGAIGLAAARAAPVRVGDLGQIRKYADSVRRSFGDAPYIGPGLDVPLPTSLETRSRLAVPAMSRGQVVGVLVVESPQPAAFDGDDESVLGAVATLLASMIELDRASTPVERAPADDGHDRADRLPVRVRHFASDGSVFLDDDYLIRGVAGRVLWSLLTRHERSGQRELTLKELRLDRSLELPGFRDNLDTRVVLLKRRLVERDAPIRLHRPGRGRVAIELTAPVVLEAHD